MIDGFYEEWLAEEVTAAFDANPFDEVETLAEAEAMVVSLDEYHLRHRCGM